MSSRSRFAGLAITGGTLWFLAPVTLNTIRGISRLYFEYLLTITPMFFVIALYGFYRTYAGEYKLYGRIGIVLIGVGTLAFIPLATHQTIDSYTLPVGIILIVTAHGGAILAEIGTITLAIDAWRTRVPSRSMAIWLPLALPATVLTNSLGEFIINSFSIGFYYYTGLFGLAWIGMGIELWRSGKTIPQTRAN